MPKGKHDVQVFVTADGKRYWSCATCQQAGPPVQSDEKAQEGADSHSGGG